MQVSTKNYVSKLHEKIFCFSLHVYLFCPKSYSKNCFDHKFIIKEWYRSLILVQDLHFMTQNNITKFELKTI